MIFQIYSSSTPAGGTALIKADLSVSTGHYDMDLSVRCEDTSGEVEYVFIILIQLLLYQVYTLSM